MSCPPLYDFMSGTRIVLPRALADQRRSHQARDILRPNEDASVLVAEHLRMLVEQVAPEVD